jgi:hypothetical protein
MYAARKRASLGTKGLNPSLSDFTHYLPRGKAG